MKKIQVISKENQLRKVNRRYSINVTAASIGDKGQNFFKLNSLYGFKSTDSKHDIKCRFKACLVIKAK